MLPAARVPYSPVSEWPLHITTVEDELATCFGKPCAKPLKTQHGTAAIHLDSRSTSTDSGTPRLLVVKRNTVSANPGDAKGDDPLQEWAMTRMLSCEGHPCIMQAARLDVVLLLKANKKLVVNTIEFGGPTVLSIWDGTAPVNVYAGFDLPPPVLLADDSRENKRFKRLVLFLDVLYAIDYLHNHQFVAHLDLKHENVVYSYCPRVKRFVPMLIDFGYARVAVPAGLRPDHTVSDNVAEELLQIANERHTFSSNTLAQLTKIAHAGAEERVDEHQAGLFQTCQMLTERSNPTVGLRRSLSHAANTTAAAVNDNTVINTNNAALEVGEIDGTEDEAMAAVASQTPCAISRSLPDLTGTVTVDPVCALIGTVKYMSPEVLGGKFDPFKADIYALGVMLFTFLTECAPYDNTTHPGYKVLKANGATALVHAYGFSLSASELAALEGMMAWKEEKRCNIKDAIKLVEAVVEDVRAGMENAELMSGLNGGAAMND